MSMSLCLSGTAPGKVYLHSINCITLNVYDLVLRDLDTKVKSKAEFQIAHFCQGGKLQYLQSVVWQMSVFELFILSILNANKKHYMDPNVHSGTILSKMVMSECGYSVGVKSPQPVLVDLVDHKHRTGIRKIWSMKSL